MKIKRRPHVKLSYLRFPVAGKLRVALWGLGVAFVLFAVFYAGAVAAQNELLKKFRRYAFLCTLIPPHFLESLTVNPDQLSIDIKHTDFRKLVYHREVALQTGLIITTEDSYVPAKVTVGGKTVKADIRLKGDISNHVEGDKWSLRIKVKGDDSIYGMKRFSIQDPKTSGYIYEWILHKLYEYEGLISLRYKYVNVTINGKRKGIYALEESFSKELIENNKRREGAIVKFDESNLWDGTSRNRGTVKTQADIFFASEIDSFRTKKVMADDVLRGNFLTAKQLLENFRQGNIPASDAFDIDKAARLYALATLTKTGHALRWKNVRFYYNPISCKLELIGYNAYTESKRIGIVNSATSEIFSGRYFVPQYHGLFFNDDTFYNSYINELNRISDKDHLDKFFGSISDELHQNLKIIYRDCPWFLLDEKDYYSNQQMIRQTLIPMMPVKAKVKIHSQPGHRRQFDFMAANTAFLPVVVESIEIDYGKTTRAIKLKPQTLPGKNPGKALIYHPIAIADNEDFEPADANDFKGTLQYHVSALPDRSFRSPLEVVGVDLSETLFLSNTEKRLDELSQNKMLKLDRENRTIAILPGTWTINRTLVIPPGFTFTAAKGTIVNLVNSAMIVSNSPVNFAGAEEDPIVIRSPDATGQGLVVVNGGRRSSLRFVICRNLSNPAEGNWQLTGAVTFYESPVDISNCKFMDNHSEDSLNIIRTEFDIQQTLFSGCSSDAFDADFCEGTMADCSFTNIGNDAIDISGTQMELRNISIDNAGDKGISVGEKSTAKGVDLAIKNTEIPVTSKDLSEVVIDRIDISDSKIAFAVYQKKPEFGPSSITVKNIKLNNIEEDYLLENGSALTMDNKKIVPNHAGVSEILYGVEYGKSSK